MKTRLLETVFLVCLSVGLRAQSANYPYILKHIAGDNSLGDGGPATSAYLLSPNATVLDAAGNVYITDVDHASVRKVTTDGKISTIATDIPYTAGDIKLGRDGNIYLACTGEILKVTLSGVVTVIAGNGIAGYGGDGGPAINAVVGNVFFLAFDSSGNLFFTEIDNYRVREITLDGKIHTVAGTGTAGSSGDGGLATAAQLVPYGIAVDSAGNIYVADQAGPRIRKITTDGKIQTIAGNGKYGSEIDGVALNSPLPVVDGVALDNSNNIYFSGLGSQGIQDGWNYFGFIYEVTPDGRIKHLAGSAATGAPSASDTPALNALFKLPFYIAFDSTGTTLYITDVLTNLVQSLGPDGIVHTKAGAIRFTGNGGAATSAVMDEPGAMLLDAQGDLLFDDSGNLVVRKISPAGTINTYVGNNIDQYPPNGGSISSVRGMVGDPTGTIYMAMNRKVEKIAPAGTFTVLAGNGLSGLGTDGGPALLTASGILGGIARDQAGNLYVTDHDFNRIRMISAVDGTISNFAGQSNGSAGFSGDGGPATAATLSLSSNNNDNRVPLAFDSQGNLYFADSLNSRVRMINSGGTINTVVGNGAYGQSVDGQQATQTPFGHPTGLAVDASGTIYVSQDMGDIYKVSGGVIRRIGGGGTQLAADGADARTASNMNLCSALLVDPNGDLYVSNCADQIWKLIQNSPAALSINRGNNQTGQVGWTLPNPLQVVVNGRAGVAVPGVSVSFAVTSGSATVAGSVFTDASGIASVPLTLGTSTGAVTVTASISGIPPVVFNATAIAAPPSGGACTITSAPSITSVNSLTDFGAFSSFTPGSWIEIKGAGLAVDTRLWTGADFQGSTAPSGLDTSQVTIDGEAAFVEYISGGQINAQVPADSNYGPVKIMVTNCAGSSAPFTGHLAALEPGMLAPASFNINGKQYLVALFQDGVTYVGNAGLIPGVPFRPGKPGDTITAYGVGFGPVMPPVAPGTVASESNSIPNFSLSFGATLATMTYAGLAPNAVGLYQFNITVPQVVDGDYQINVSVGSTQVQQTVYLTVHH